MERVAATHKLRVGVTDNPPWVAASSAIPTGIEPTLAQDFAQGLGAKVLWTRGSETGLTESLKSHDLDIVIGGFDKKTQWSASVAVSQPFATGADGKKHVFLAGPGENAFLLRLDRFLTDRKRGAKAAS